MTWLQEALVKLPREYVLHMPAASLEILFRRAEEGGLSVDEFIEWHNSKGVKLDDFIAAKKATRVEKQCYWECDCGFRAPVPTPHIHLR